MPGSGKFRGWLAAGAAGVVLAGVTAISLPSPESPTGSVRIAGQAGLGVSEQPPEVAVRGLLEQRAAAVRAGDEAAFAATVDPKAPHDFQRRQLELFRNLATVPVTEWAYELDATTGDRPVVPEADETWAPRVELRYALADVDSVPTQRPLGYVFARRGGSWYVAADDAKPGAWRGPWDFGPCQVKRTATGLVIGHQREPVERVARQLDAAVADVTEVWGPNWSQRVGVLLPESQEELRALVGPEFAVDGIAAVAVADRVNTTTRRVEGPRVVLNPKTANQLSDIALRVVLRHEITHIAARADTVDGAPMWMLEGFADYVGYRNSGVAPKDIAPDLVRHLREAGPPAKLPADGDFHQAGRRLDLAYQQSWSLVHYLAERLGEPRVVELYRRVAATNDEAAADQAVRDVTGQTTQQLIADWGTQLSRTFR
ncbi:basic secretory family protein [Saccharopolyspora sp. K220]|uniref:basic secretory family protein n=1 Tax=Saccharopolyspora soli TaxID=2926618 RepID=UPI001F58EBB7|nr:basic secretory family protein [Saccharopolyspora soli]MCI2421279.1 basic secretory family protein [Saccharopolyspora soli]